MSEDPAFKVAEIDIKLTRANNLLGKVSSIPKPKEPKVKKPKNIKIDNITIDGNEGNWEDFVKFDNGESDDYDEGA